MHDQCTPCSNRFFKTAPDRPQTILSWRIMTRYNSVNSVTASNSCWVPRWGIYSAKLIAKQREGRWRFDILLIFAFFGLMMEAFTGIWFAEEESLGDEAGDYRQRCMLPPALCFPAMIEFGMLTAFCRDTVRRPISHEKSLFKSPWSMESTITRK